MKRKLSFLFLSALTLPFFMVSCSDDKEEQEVKPATDLVVDNNSVTLLQGDEITVGITSGNGDYYVKPFDESVATAVINGNKVTIKATENSHLEENNRIETTVLVVDGRKKVARIQVQIAKLWDLTADVPEEGFDLFIGEKRMVKILTGNGDYEISIPEGADKYIEVGELSGQVSPVTAKFETGTEPVDITVTDKKGKTVVIPVVVNIVDLVLKTNEATFSEPDAESQYITIEKGNGGYSFTYQVGDGEPTADATIVEATEKENLITLKPKARGDVKVIVTDQKGSVEEIAVTVNPYEIKLEDNATSLTVDGFDNSKEVAISRGNGGYQLAPLTDDNKKYLKSAEIDENNRLKVEGNWLGTTTLTITDAAGKELDLPVTVMPMAALLESDRCFKIDIKKFVESNQDLNNMRQLTFEMVFYPTYSRSLQSFIGLEGVFLLRCENNGDTNLRFEIATKIHKDPNNLSGSTYSDPRFRSQQKMGNDRQGNGKWYHVAVVFDGTQSSTKEAYKMYINGVRETLTPASSDYEDVSPDPYLVLSSVSGDNALMIGRSGNSEYRLGYCAVAQARMWNVARTEDEIKADMCKFFDPEEAKNNANLLGYWVPSNGVSDISVFKNYGSAGDGLDAVVYNNGKSISPVTFPDRYKKVECPHSY